MPSIRSLTERIRMIRPLYLQLVFVALAFVGMAVSSSLYVNNMLQAHLRRDAMDLLSQTRLKIEAELLEPASALSMASQTIHKMILQGDSAQKVLEYMRSIIADLRHKKGGFAFDSLYGYFPVFGGAYLHAPGWDPPDGYDPRERPWYTAAVEAGGETALTPVYLNVRTRMRMISYVRHLADEQGNTLGVVSLNIPLDRIVTHVAGMRLTEGSYGIFHNKKMDIFYHPNPDLIGRNLHDPNSNLARYTDELLVPGGISEQEIRNYQGIVSVIFTTRFANGWCLHTVTPKAEYYQELYEMGVMLGMLGAFLALTLGCILLRVDLAKKQADEENRHKTIMLATLAKERAEDERTQIMLDAMPLSCMLWNSSFELLACNQETAYLFNVPNKQDFHFDLHSPERQPCGGLSSEMARGYLKTAFEEGYFRLEWTHRKSTGELFPTEIVLVRVKHREEYIVAAYIRDLSEWKAMLGAMYKVEEELRLARDAAEAASSFKSAFLANMSHEIRTPMNAILGITEIQLQDETLEADRREAFHRIYSSSDLLLGIINDILDMSKIESGKLELVPAAYDVASVINDAVQLNILRIGSRPIEFVLEVDENTPSTVVGDALRVKQILNNVLSNAFKYTAQGMVRLFVSHERASGEGAPCALPAPDAGDGEREPDVTLVFRVRDTGQGMTMEQVSRMFEKYTRFNRNANRATEGTGLGMSITWDLVHMMNGEISVESEPGAGSLFTVRLPQGSAGSEVLGRELAENLRQFHGDSTGHMKRAQIAREPMPYGSVLVVDDVETNLYVAKGLLAPYGLTVELAVSGFAALEKIEQGRVYDIVFMDHMMPEMDGMRATSLMRARGYSWPIVALTANAVVGQAEIFRENGFNEFISKPIDIRELNAVLNRFVRDRHSPDVVEAARRDAQVSDAHEAEAAPRASDASKLAVFFLRDAWSAISVLEAFSAHEDACTDDALRGYVVAVHGIKSALANIGEQEASGLASVLEEAGRERNFAVMAEQTPALLGVLRKLIEKHTPVQDDAGRDAIRDADPHYLHDRLRTLREACVAYDKKAAKDALAELQHMAWPQPTRELLDAIAGHLLHSKFKDIVHVVDTMLYSTPDAKVSQTAGLPASKPRLNQV